ncbi:MAG TPA: hypothetical protein VHW46_17745 [Terracidiphilus sp.]|jgi:hypothetical protein|nr:hypothetical protein [Terracidiphilus sp.]
MGIVSIPKRKVQQIKKAIASQVESPDLMKVAAGGTLIAGGILLLTGNRRAGIAVSVAGAALTLLTEQDMVRSWWEQVPEYVGHLENMVDRVKESMEEITVTRDNLRHVLTGTGH